MLYLASDYQNGNEFIKKDISKTIFLAEKLFNQNGIFVQEAASILSVQYFNNEKTRNYDKAFFFNNYLYQKESSLMWKDDYFRLGYMYEKGLGTTKNLVKAKKMYALSAKKGNEDAIERLKILK